MDIASLFPIAQDLPIHLPDGSATDIVFKVVGQDSKQFHEVARRHFQALVEAKEKPSIDKQAQDNAELLAATVVGWDNLTSNGEPIPYSREKAIELLANPELSFLREQVEAYVTKRTHFFRAGSTEA